MRACVFACVRGCVHVCVEADEHKLIAGTGRSEELQINLTKGASQEYRHQTEEKVKQETNSTIQIHKRSYKDRHETDRK